MDNSTTKSPSSYSHQVGSTRSPGSQVGLHKTLWSAIIFTIVIIACIAASACIVLVSNNRPVESWRVHPPVLLAILSSVLNLALGAALTTGVGIAWFRSAARGTKLANLHHIWEHGKCWNPIPALSRDTNVKRVVLVAMIVAIVQFINNPLLQRATETISYNVTTKEPMMLEITQHLPDGWHGKIQNASMQLIVGGPHGLSAAQGWWSNSTITTHDRPGFYCNGTCIGKVPGAGISYSCNSTTLARDLLANSSHNSIIFAINTTMNESSTGVPSLLTTTLYSSTINDSCIATIQIDTCRIESAVVEYPITIRGSTVTLNNEELQHMTIDSTYISAGDLLTAPPNAGAGPLQGINDFIGYYLFANVTEKLRNRPKPYYLGPSMIADMFYIADPSLYSNYTLAKCNLKWNRTTEFVLNSMHNFMFRSALSAGNGTAQIFIANRISQTLVYHSTYRYLGAGLGAIFIALLAALSLFWGCWELGWDVSLSPLETAKALGSPMLQLTGRNCTANGIINTIGDLDVQFKRETTGDEMAIIVESRINSN